MTADNTKIDRVPMSYEQLRSGRAVNKAAAEFGVTERSIQRGIDTLRAFFRSRPPAKEVPQRSCTTGSKGALSWTVSTTPL